jgi:peptidoglycan/LPS O-acetylase OafA/YrhL
VGIALLFSDFLFIVEDSRFVLYYLRMFLPGIILYWYQSQRISLNLFLVLVLFIAVSGFFVFGIVAPICTAITLLFLCLRHKPWKPHIFLGTISHSLYLIHTIVGTDGIINFMQNYILLNYRVTFNQSFEKNKVLAINYNY